MDTMQCPHCMGDVPVGARVCRGCKATVRYGAPSWCDTFAAVVTFPTILIVYPMVAWLNWWGIIPTLLAWAVMGGLIQSVFARFFSGRVEFSRLYHDGGYVSSLIIHIGK